MATSNDSAPWVNLRLEELLRVLDIHNSESYERREQFEEKLQSLMERQEDLQERRVDRLRKEGIQIDLESVRRRAKLREDSEWFSSRKDGEIERKMIKDKISDIFKSTDTLSEDSDFEYESEPEYEIDIVQSGGQNSKRRPNSRGPSREHTNLGIICEEDGAPVFDDYILGNYKTVPVKVRKSGSKRRMKALGTALSTARYLNKFTRKRAAANSKKSSKSDTVD